jgi:uncharacterized repeat protein (TIGR03847 family)
MARVIHVFRQPDRFVAGTVGQPGDRMFYLQATEEARMVSVALEKQQVSVLAERISAQEEKVKGMESGSALDKAIERLDHFKQVDNHLQGTALH